MHDEWTQNATHYIGLYLSSFSNVSIHENGRTVTKSVPFATLIAVLPIGQSTCTSANEISNINYDDDGTSSFDTTTHIYVFKTIF